MVAFGFDQAAVEYRQLGINGLQFGGQELKLLATSALDERAANQVIDDLMALPIADRAH